MKASLQDSLQTRKALPIAKPVPFSLKLLRLFFKTAGLLFPKKVADVALHLFMTPKRHKVKNWPRILDQAYILGIPYQGGKVRAFMWGYTGKIVLLVHGWESGVHMFAPFINPLLQEGYRVVALEGPAHGNSLQKETNMIDFGNAVEAVFQRLEKSGGVSIAIGHSFGGSTLTYIGSKNALPYSLEKLVLIAIPTKIDDIFYQYFEMMHIPMAAQKKMVATIEGLFNLPLNDLKVKLWSKNIQNTKVLLVHDRQDKVIGFEAAEELVTYWPVATLIETTNLGHYRIMKNEPVIVKILGFLNQGM